jgi:hypothetical protein
MAKLQHRMRDTFEALRLATVDNRWAAVVKYATELQTMAAEHCQLFGCVYEIRDGSSACR